MPNRRLANRSSRTRHNSDAINITPSAESSTYCPFCQYSQIMIDRTSDPGLYRSMELDRWGMEKITTEIHPEISPGLSNGRTTRQNVMPHDAPLIVADSSSSLCSASMEVAL